MKKKTGPKPSGGLKRTIPFLIMLNADEWEYLHRIERFMKSSGHPQKKVQRIRERVFPNRWLARLRQLRDAQGGNVKP